jgi:hypothetical protein
MFFGCVIGLALCSMTMLQHVAANLMFVVTQTGLGHTESNQHISLSRHSLLALHPAHAMANAAVG